MLDRTLFEQRIKVQFRAGIGDGEGRDLFVANALALGAQPSLDCFSRQSGGGAFGERGMCLETRMDFLGEGNMEIFHGKSIMAGNYGSNCGRGSDSDGLKPRRTGSPQVETCATREVAHLPVLDRAWWFSANPEQGICEEV